jgi:hypothetical protein
MLFFWKPLVDISQFDINNKRESSVPPTRSARFALQLRIYGGGSQGKLPPSFCSGHTAVLPNAAPVRTYKSNLLVKLSQKTSGFKNLCHILISPMVSMGRRNTHPKSYQRVFQWLNSFARVDSRKTLACLRLVEYSPKN